MQFNPDQIVYGQWEGFGLSAALITIWIVMALLVLGSWLMTRRLVLVYIASELLEVVAGFETVKIEEKSMHHLSETRQLWLLRHAKSDWQSAALRDFDRPLNDRGKRDAVRMGRWLFQRGWIPQWIVASPARRVRQTVKRVCQPLGFDVSRVHWDKRIYEADTSALLTVLRALPESAVRVLLVGHNPALEGLLEKLSGLPPAVEGKVFPTAALAHLAISSPWKDLSPGKARLLDLVRPRDLPEGF